jgi:hypothetical protein
MANMARIDGRALQQQIANLYLDFPELRDDDEMLKLDMLEGATDLHELATVIVRAERESKALFDGTDTALGTLVEDLKARKARFKRRGQFLRAMLLKIMQAAEIKKLELPIATLSQRSSPPQIVGEPDVALLPDDLCRLTREPNRSAIREALERGDEVPGLFLSNAPPSLSIHAK